MNRFDRSFDFWQIVAAYLVTRFFALLTFAPHADEILYTQFAQWISRDWRQNHLVSIDGRIEGYFNGPLQYWLTSLTVERFANPIFAVRLWSMVAGLMGLWFCYLFVTRVWDRTAANITAILILASEHFFYFDVIGIMEVYVYSCGIAFSYFLWRLLSESHASLKQKWLWFVWATIFCSASLLAKELGKLWVITALGLPLLALTQGAQEFKGWRHSGKLLFTDYSLIALSVVGAVAGYFLIVPYEYYHVRVANLADHEILYSLSDVFSRSPRLWLYQLKFYFFKIIAADYAGPTIFLIALVMGIPLFLAKRGKSVLAMRFVILTMIFVASWAPFVVFLRTHFVRNWGVGLYWWYILLGCGLAVIYDELAETPRRILGAGALGLLITLRVFGSYTDLQRWKQTDYAMVETYLGRYNGIGIVALMNSLKTLPKGIVYCEAAWAHPCVDVEVFQKSYPQLEIRRTTPNTENELPRILDDARDQGLPVYFIHDSEGPLPQDQFMVALSQRPKICKPQGTFPKRYKTKIGSTIRICSIDPINKANEEILP